MKISGQTKFIAGLFIGHFIISPISDGRVKKVFEKITQSKENLNNDFEKVSAKNKEFFIDKYGKTNGERYYDLFINRTLGIYPKSNDGDEERSGDSRLNNDNRSNQMNPNNDAYWQSREYNERPDNWQSGGNQEYSQQELDNHSNQMNPNNEAYNSSRGK